MLNHQHRTVLILILRRAKCPPNAENHHYICNLRILDILSHKTLFRRVWRRRKKWRINAATDRNDNRWLRTKRETCSINYTKIYENILLSIKRKHQINSVQRTTTVNAKRAHVCIHFCTEQRSCYQRSHFIGSRCVGFLSDKNKIHREWMNASIAHAHNYVDFVVIWNNIISTHTLSMKLSNLFAYKKAVATKKWTCDLFDKKKERLWFCSLA